MMKLYIFDHCPFCVKARMIFGLKQIPVELITLLNDDEATPVSMVGKKVVPILQKQDGSYMPESMDIVYYVDQLKLPMILTGKSDDKLTAWMQHINGYVNKLLMPRYVKADFAEFATQSARDYYQHKKEAMIGSFDELLAKSPALIEQVNQDLLALDKLIVFDDGCNGELSTDDIHLFPILRGLSIVKGIVYPAKVKAYRDRMAKLTHINLLDDIAM